MNDQINFTDSVVTKLKEILTEDNTPGNKFRVYVQGGGCSGFSYGFALDTEVNDDDFTFDRDGVALVVDSMSMQYLNGATIDFKEDLYGSSFVIDNPGATSTCGCGSSFSM